MPQTVNVHSANEAGRELFMFCMCQEFVMLSMENWLRIVAAKILQMTAAMKSSKLVRLSQKKECIHFFLILGYADDWMDASEILTTALEWALVRLCLRVVFTFHRLLNGLSRAQAICTASRIIPPNDHSNIICLQCVFDNKEADLCTSNTEMIKVFSLALHISVHIHPFTFKHENRKLSFSDHFTPLTLRQIIHHTNQFNFSWSCSS